MDKIKVIVVDDSALMRKIISDIINSQEDMEVINVARNGEDLFVKLNKQTPDIITLDVEMPKMDGISTLKEMKRQEYNIPVIMLSSISKKGTALTIKCLENGAFDFIAKPSGAISLDMEKVKESLIEKIRLGCSKRNYILDMPYENPKTFKVENLTPKNRAQRIDAVSIGASTGGPKALYSVITELPDDINVPVFVVQHMPVGFTKAFAERLNNNSKLKVVEASEGDIIQRNVVYVAPGGFHMLVGEDNKIHLDTSPTIWGVRPAVDKLFISAAEVYTSHLLSVVLTGMGKDGAEGTVRVKQKGGITISEDKSTCTIYGMPKAAFETGKVDEVLPLYEIPKAIIKIIKDARR